MAVFTYMENFMFNQKSKEILKTEETVVSTPVSENALNEATTLSQEMQPKIDEANRDFLEKLNKAKGPDFEYQMTCESFPLLLKTYYKNENIGYISIRNDRLKVFVYDQLKGNIPLIHVDTLNQENQGFGDNFELLDMAETAIIDFLNS